MYESAHTSSHVSGSYRQEWTRILVKYSGTGSVINLSPLWPPEIADSKKAALTCGRLINNLRTAVLTRVIHQEGKRITSGNWIRRIQLHLDGWSLGKNQEGSCYLVGKWQQKTKAQQSKEEKHLPTSRTVIAIQSGFSILVHSCLLSWFVTPMVSVQINRKRKSGLCITVFEARCRADVNYYHFGVRWRQKSDWWWVNITVIYPLQVLALSLAELDRSIRLVRKCDTEYYYMWILYATRLVIMCIHRSGKQRELQNWMHNLLKTSIQDFVHRLWFITDLMFKNISATDCRNFTVQSESTGTINF